MQIRKIELYNYRNYEHLSLKFSNNINLLFGNNGSGKTNLIEAIYVLAITKSFRTKEDKLLITDKKNQSYIEGEIYKRKLNKYKIIIDENGKRAQINDVLQKKLSEYISNINIVIFNPDDLLIIKDTPSYRRKTLNCEISQLDNKYLNLLNNYNQILKNRNCYLRSMYFNKNKDNQYLNVLTEKLIKEGLKIYGYRKKFIAEINQYLPKLYEKITNLKGLKLSYQSDYNSESFEKILAKYQKSVEKDLILGKTQIGIHHDDYNFNILSKNLKYYGSEGQKKNAIIAFKLAEIETFKMNTNEYPILILDDLFSALDSRKINNIIKLLKKRVQVFITITDILNIKQELLKHSKIFKITNGKAEEYKNEK